MILYLLNEKLIVPFIKHLTVTCNNSNSNSNNNGKLDSTYVRFR